MIFSAAEMMQIFFLGVVIKTLCGFDWNGSNGTNEITSAEIMRISIYYQCEVLNFANPENSEIHKIKLSKTFADHNL